MKQKIKKDIAIGILFSIIATSGGLFIYLEYVSDYGFKQTLELIVKGNLYAPVLALAALPNLFVFFVFIKKRQDYKARGVLIATIFIALLTFVLKLV